MGLDGDTWLRDDELTKEIQELSQKPNQQFSNHSSHEINYRVPRQHFVLFMNCLLEIFLMFNYNSNKITFGITFDIVFNNSGLDL